MNTHQFKTEQVNPHAQSTVSLLKEIVLMGRLFQAEELYKRTTATGTIGNNWDFLLSKVAT